MATNAKTYLDLAGLTTYDGKIKEWANSANQVAYKTVLKSADGNSLLFYKKANAVEGTDTADKTITLGSSDVADKIAALENLIPSTYDGTTKKYSLVGVDTDVAGETIVAVANNINGKVGALASLTTTAKGTIVAAINELKEVLDNLDVEEFALTEDNNNVISIFNIKEENGKIAKGASKIDLAKVAKTGKAEDVTITEIKVDDKTAYAAGTTTQAVLQDVAEKISANDAAAKVTVEEGEASGDVLKSYSFYQGVLDSDDDAAKAAKKLTTINIPKDYLVKSAEIKVAEAKDEPIEGLEPGDKYIDFTINTKDGEGTGTEQHLYIAVNDLVHPLSGYEGEEITVTVDANNQISATVNKIAASKIDYKTGENAETVAQALTRIDGADTVEGSIKKAVKDGIEALDVEEALPFAVYAAGADGAADVITIKGGVKETDGKIVDGEGDEITLSTITTAQINGLF